MITAAAQSGLVHNMHLDQGWTIFWLIIGLGVGYWFADLRYRAMQWLFDAGYEASSAIAVWGGRALMAVGGATLGFLIFKWQGWA